MITLRETGDIGVEVWRRFIVFAWNDYEAAGGVTDIVAMTDALQEARDVASRIKKGPIAPGLGPFHNTEVLDLMTGIVE